MTVKPYSDVGSKREQVERMFDAISPKYDLLNRLFSLGIDQGWRRTVIRMVKQQPVDRLLDVATGTADLAIMAARKHAAKHVTGADISEGMLMHGREKVKDAGLDDRVELLRADSAALPFADGAFDAVTVAFGARNFEDLERGLREMLRVLRPGGHLIVLEFSKPHGTMMGALFRFYFHRVMPAIGRLVSRDSAAYSYLPQSVDAFPDGEEFLRIVARCGGRDARMRRLTGGVATIYHAVR